MVKPASSFRNDRVIVYSSASDFYLLMELGGDGLNCCGYPHALYSYNLRTTES